MNDNNEFVVHAEKKTARENAESLYLFHNTFNNSYLITPRMIRIFSNSKIPTTMCDEKKS